MDKVSCTQPHRPWSETQRTLDTEMRKKSRMACDIINQVLLTLFPGNTIAKSIGTNRLSKSYEKNQGYFTDSRLSRESFNLLKEDIYHKNTLINFDKNKFLKIHSLTLTLQIAKIKVPITTKQHKTSTETASIANGRWFPLKHSICPAKYHRYREQIKY